MAAIGLPEVVAGLLVVALNAYVLTGGADFGGGVWDLFARGPRRDAQRAQIAASLAPIWEANHVWLIVVIVVLFTGFPSAFSTLGIVLHIPLTLLLVGIVLRGSAFVFRSYGSATTAQRQGWGLTFAIASTITPLVLGMVVGALATGDVGRAAARVADPSASFADVYLAPWLGAFPIAVGVFALALFSMLAAVYLAYGASDEAIRDDFRLRALMTAVVVAVLAAITFGVGLVEAPRIATGVAGSPWSIALVVATMLAAAETILALVRRNYRIARVAAGAQVSLILWGWILAQYPYVVPESLTIRGAAAGRETLVLLVVGLVVGMAILVPALAYLFGLFARERATPR